MAIAHMGQGKLSCRYMCVSNQPFSSRHALCRFDCLTSEGSAWPVFDHELITVGWAILLECNHLWRHVHTTPCWIPQSTRFFTTFWLSYDSLTIFTVWPLFDHFLIGVIPCSDPLTTLCCIVWPCFDCCLTFFGPTFWLSLTTLTFLIVLTSMVQNRLSPQIVGNFITNIEIFWA